MARIRKWQETLMVACAALFLSLTRAWPLGARSATGNAHPAYSRLVTGVSGKTAFGVELETRRPYVRLFRASLIPVAMPLAAGAYVAMAGAQNGAGAQATGAGSAAPAASSCASCNRSTATCCSHADGAKCCDPECTRSCTELITLSAFSGGTQECIICRYNYGGRGTTTRCHTD